MFHLERGGFERRLADEESVHDTAEGPHVGREAVTLLVQHLGGDVVRGPADGPATQGEAKPSGTLLLYGTTWIRVFLGLLDPEPEPLGRGRDPDLALVKHKK